MTFHASSIKKEKRNERRKVGLYNIKRKMTAWLCRRQNESTVDHMMIPELTYTLLAPASLSSRRTHTGAHEKLITSHFGKFTHSPSTEGPIVL